MKKLSLLIAMVCGAMCALYGQQQQPSAKVPAAIRETFRHAHPDIKNPEWQKYNNEWWRVSYMLNAEKSMTQCYENTGQSYSIGMPIRETNVSREALTYIENKFGAEVYSITKVKGENGTNMYVVNILRKDGRLKKEAVSLKG